MVISNGKELFNPEIRLDKFYSFILKMFNNHLSLGNFRQRCGQALL